MRLEKREKILVTLAACAVGIFLLLHFLVFPFLDKREALIRGVNAKREALQEMVGLRSTYLAYQKGTEGISERLRTRSKRFTLFSFLEQAAHKGGIKDHIKYMQPSDAEGTGPFKESMVEMKLDKITLKQLVAYLYLIESPEDAVGIKRISIKDSKSAPGYLDAIIQVLTFTLRQK
ncbi:MAG: hypothetical protein R6U38_11175 [Desulfatiglandaceae bacterium]